jgi:hypothetical protein
MPEVPTLGDPADPPAPLGIPAAAGTEPALPPLEGEPTEPGAPPAPPLPPPVPPEPELPPAPPEPELPPEPMPPLPPELGKASGFAPAGPVLSSVVTDSTT